MKCDWCVAESNLTYCTECHKEMCIYCAQLHYCNPHKFIDGECYCGTKDNGPYDTVCRGKEK